MNFHIKIEGVKEAFEKFSPKVVEKATISTLNEVAKSAKTLASTLVRKERGWKISKQDFDDKIKFIAAKRSDTRAILSISRFAGSKKASFALPYFGAKEILKYKAGGVRITTRKLAKKQKRTKSGSGVTVQVKRGGREARFPHGFIAVMKSGHIGAFRRIEGKARTGRQKIREIKVITAAEMFAGTINQLKIHASEQFKKRFPSKLEWANRK